MQNIEIIISPYFDSDWTIEDGVYLIGYAFIGNRLYKTNELITLFNPIESIDDFKHLLLSLNGSFAVIINKKNLVVFAVDRLRTFPLLYSIQGESIIIKNRISPVDEQNYIDEKQLENLSKIFCTEERSTFYTNWLQLCAGDFAYKIGDKKLVVEKYYSHFATLKREFSFTEIHSAFENAIKRTIQLIGSRPIFIPLSGGYDSRLLLCLLLKQVNKEQITCYTYGQPNSTERVIAEEVCKILKVKWFFIEYNEQLIQKILSTEWNQYALQANFASSLPEEQNFFSIFHLVSNKLIPINAVILPGFCLDVLGGSFLRKYKIRNLIKYISTNYQIQSNYQITPNVENWDLFQDWYVRNRLSKYINNSRTVFNFFGIDTYMPFWDNELVELWYQVPYNKRLFSVLFHSYIFENHFNELEVGFKRIVNYKFSKFKFILKKIIPDHLIRYKTIKNQRQSDDLYNSHLYEILYNQVSNPLSRNFNTNQIHAEYFIEKFIQ